jgi:hypothetical protein
MTATGQKARVPDQAQRMSAFARSLPDRAMKRSVARKNDGEGDVAGRCTKRECICDGEQPGKACALVAGGQRAFMGPGFPDRSARVAHRRVQADSEQVIMAKHNAGGLAAGNVAQAQAKPRRAAAKDKMVVVQVAVLCHWQPAWRNRCEVRVSRLDDRDARRNCRRPQRRSGSWAGERIYGESKGPTARPGPPLFLEQIEAGHYQALHGRGDRPDSGAETHEQNRQSHGPGTPGSRGCSVFRK